MTEGSSNTCVPKYAGHYDHWAELMENLLRSKDHWDVVEHGVTMKTTEARMFSTVVTINEVNSLRLNESCWKTGG